jgi:hypothetical protein
VKIGAIAMVDVPLGHVHPDQRHPILYFEGKTGGQIIQLTTDPDDIFFPAGDFDCTARILNLHDTIRAHRALLVNFVPSLQSSRQGRQNEKYRPT